MAANSERFRHGQPVGTVSGGTVVLGTVTGPPPPAAPLEPDDVDAGFPAAWVIRSRTSRVPLFAVVTKPPMLGLEMFQSANGTVMSARASISPLSRTADTVNVTVLVTPCMSRDPVAW